MQRYSERRDEKGDLAFCTKVRSTALVDQVIAVDHDTETSVLHESANDCDWKEHFPERRIVCLTCDGDGLSVGVDL